MNLHNIKRLLERKCLSLLGIIKKVVSDCVSEQNKRVSILW